MRQGISHGVAPGAYVLRDADDPGAVIVGTGSELGRPGGRRPAGRRGQCAWIDGVSREGGE
jgi:hypothetical protein